MSPRIGGQGGLNDGTLDGVKRNPVDLLLPVPRRRPEADPSLLDGIVPGDYEGYLPDIDTGAAPPTLKTTNYAFVTGDNGKTFSFVGSITPGYQQAIWTWLPLTNPGTGWTVTIENNGLLPVSVVPQQVRTTATVPNVTGGSAVTGSLTAMPCTGQLTAVGPNPPLGIQPGMAVASPGTSHVSGAVTVNHVTTNTNLNHADATQVNVPAGASLTAGTVVLLTFSGPSLNGSYQWLTIAPGQTAVITSDGTSYEGHLVGSDAEASPAGNPTWYWIGFNLPGFSYFAPEALPWIGYGYDGINFHTIKNPAVVANIDQPTLYNPSTLTPSGFTGATYPLYLRDECIVKSPVPNPDGSPRWWMTCTEGVNNAFGLHAYPGFTTTTLGLLYSDDLVNWTQVPGVDFYSYVNANGLAPVMSGSQINVSGLPDTVLGANPVNEGIVCDGTNYYQTIFFGEISPIHTGSFLGAIIRYFLMTFGPGTCTIATTPTTSNNCFQWTNFFDPTTGLYHGVQTGGGMLGVPSGPSGFAGHAVSNVGPSNPSSWVSTDSRGGVTGGNIPTGYDGTTVVRLPQPTAAGNVWRAYANAAVDPAHAFGQTVNYWDSPDLYDWYGAPAGNFVSPNYVSFTTMDGSPSFSDSLSALPMAAFGSVNMGGNGGGANGYDPDAVEALAAYVASQGSGGGSDFLTAAVISVGN